MTGPRIKPVGGWVPAGDPFREALAILSDGTFKLFVWLCLRAEPHTGRLTASQTELARALGKSRRSIVSHLRELRSNGVCHVQPGLNQSSPGSIEILDAFWPYRKTRPDSESPERDYVERAARLFERLPGVAGPLTDGDRQTAARLHGEGVPLADLERALLLGSARKHVAWLNGHEGPPIRSLGYFLPILEEVRHQPVADEYWEHIKRRLPRLQQQRSEQLKAACAKFAQPNTNQRRDDDADSTSKPVSR